MTEAHPHTANLVGLTAEIVAAYVSNNSVPMSQLPGLIAETPAAMVSVSAPSNIGEPEEKPIPAVSVRKSITPDFLVCLEDGKKFKSLKRHLATHHDLTPEQYREKWKLPAEYPWWLQTIPRHARCWRRVQGSVENRRQSNRQLLPGDRR